MTENKDMLDDPSCEGCEEGEENIQEIDGDNIQFVGDLQEIFGKIDFAKEAERDESIRVVLRAFKNDLEGKSEDTLKHFTYLYDLYIGNNIK